MPHRSEKILNSLNEQQKEAVLHKNGGLLVIAGAGSGKTRVITARIAHLLAVDQMPPESIIALTFTNKAAREMKERIIHFVGEGNKMPFVGTFHAYCLLLLRKFKQLTSFETFSILDAEDQEQMLRRILKQHGCEKQMTASALQSFISQQKNGSEVLVYVPPLFKQLAAAYEEEKERSHALDFDDLMIKVLQGFKKSPEFKASFQERIRHILVDEYQDTNSIQHALLQEMACTEKKSLAIDSICAVGDEDQSIYSWRGAQVTNMHEFVADFAPVTIVKIEQNYRSVLPILQAANGLIAHNTKRMHKELWSEKKGSDRVLMLHCQSGYQEADAIARYVATLPETMKKSDVAILYRTHYQSRNIEEALMKQGIPYHIVGGLRFYERKEIKDILAYLRLVVNPYDRVSFLRVFNVPHRGLGQKFEEMLLGFWEQDPGLSFKELLQKYCLDEGAVSGIKAVAVKNFIELFDGLTAEHEPSEVTETILSDIGYKEYLKQQYDPDEAQTKIENCREFLNSMIHAQKKAITSTGQQLTLATFLHEVALLQEKIEADEQKEDSVHLMTLHAVKGLEFHTVCIIGLEEGLLPSSRSLNNAAALEEERRLFYVGMTRAQERLIIAHADQRMSFGQLQDQTTSRFVDEVAVKHKNQLDVRGEPLFMVEKSISSWRSGIKPSLKATDFSSTMQTFGSKKVSRSVVAKKSFQRFTPAGSTTWSKDQMVVHKTFGKGIIRKVEKKDDELFLLTIIFKEGEKKILSSFVQKA